MSKAAVILSGCGYKEGTEIHECVLSYLALAEEGIGYHSFAQSARLEASRPLARDQISLLSTLQEKDYDILWLPGGFGVAKYLTTFSTDGPNCTVDPDVRRVIEAFYVAKKPIVAICFAPVVVAKVLEGKGIEMTLGSKKEDGAILALLGMRPKFCKVEEICVDHFIYTTPGYMEPPSIAGIYQGIRGIISALAKGT